MPNSFDFSAAVVAAGWFLPAIEAVEKSEI
jgi:hypothetical protein